MVVWITGLSASGKTTLARELQRQLREAGESVLLLDGDAVRKAVGNDAGHDRKGRIRNARRICRLAAMAESQGLTVVVATMSLFHRIHAWNRKHFQDYVEVFLQVDLEVLKKRDPRGLYRRAENGDETNVGGLDLGVELPEAPHLTIENVGGDEQVRAAAREIAAAVRAKTGAAPPILESYRAR